MSDTVHVAGVGMTPTGKFLHASLHELAAGAVRLALADAGAGAAQVQAAHVANVGASYLQGQHMVAGQVLLRPLGIAGIPVLNVENACASASTAFWLACHSVRSGQVDIALALGVEKLSHPDKRRSFELFGGGCDVAQPQALQQFLDRQRAAGGDAPPSAEGGERSIFMDIYAALAMRHMRRYGLTRRQLACVAAKNHAHSVHNERAQYRQAVSVEQVLAARPVAWPLTLPMCAPIGDGAAAAVVCNDAGLRRLAGRGAVRVLACELATGTDHAEDDFDAQVTRRAGLAAYARAGLGPGDIDVAEVHDATAFGEVLQTEALGWCAPGDGGAWAESGASALGGRLPVNVSGGLESKGHPIGATGLMQVGELVLQLRGQAGALQVPGARIALAENGGGFVAGEEAVACVTVLGRCGP